MRFSIRYIVFLICAQTLTSCTKTVTEPQIGTPTPSFVKLQEKVLTKICAQCHTSGNIYADQSGLILDPDVAYKNLVGVSAHHTNALSDGLMRIKAGKADSSLIYMKVHGFPNGKDYGSRMPLGLTPLSIGQIQFIHDWINAGAPHSGVVADSTLLDDTTHTPVTEFTPLAPPNPGEGFQITTGKFDVGSNFEREIFIFRHLGNTAPVFVNRIKTKMRTNSHHLVLYTFDPGTPMKTLPKFDVYRDLRNPDGSYIAATQSQMNWHLFIGGSMVEEEDYMFPTGVALPLDVNAAIDFNTHFINRTSKTIPGECYANIYTTDLSKVQHVAQTLFLANQNFTLAPNKQTVITQDNPNSTGSAMNIFMLTSHNHEWGKKFQIKIKGGTRNGEVVYESSDWSNPVVKTFDPPIVLNDGEGLTSIVTYLNNTNRTIQFGLTSQDEMDIIYGYYY